MGTVVNLAEYTGKKVNVKLTTEDEVFEAVAEEATDFAVILRRKGKSALEMHPADEVENIELRPDVIKELKGRRLDFIVLDNIKRHLVDRHGYGLASVNAMTVEEAYEFHEGLDHSDLGHFHAEAPVKSEREEAIAAAAAGS